MKSALKQTPLYRLYGLYRLGLYPFQLLRAKASEAAEVAQSETNNLPIPPARLRHRVSSRFSAGNYLLVGANVSRDIRKILGQEGINIGDLQSVLDFGCGCGRVIRFFGDVQNLWGTDIDAKAIAWCEKNLPGSFAVNDPMPPTRFKDEQFDFIYAISVFTHLNEQMHFEWLRELKRISKRGGYLILSCQNEQSGAKHMDAAQRRELREKGFIFSVGQTGMLKLDGLPDFYQSAIQSKEYIAREWSKYFTVVRHIERGINDHQDAVLLRNI